MRIEKDDLNRFLSKGPFFEGKAPQIREITSIHGYRVNVMFDFWNGESGEGAMFFDGKDSEGNLVWAVCYENITCYVKGEAPILA